VVTVADSDARTSLEAVIEQVQDSDQDSENTNTATTMAPPDTIMDDMCLVPPGSENAVPTVRGIIEEYYEEKEFDVAGWSDERTPVYSAKPTGTSKTATSTALRLPPKAKQLLGSPKLSTNLRLFNKLEPSPLHSKRQSVSSIRRSASSRISGLITPSKSGKAPSASLSLFDNAAHGPAFSQPTTLLSAHHVQTPSPLKSSSILSSTHTHDTMSSQKQSPDKQAAPGAALGDSPFKKTANRVSSQKSPTKSSTSPKKGDFSLKRAMSNALTPKLKRTERGPTPPEKDTPPDLRLSANITDVASRPFDAYSGHAFATVGARDEHDAQETAKINNKITVAIRDMSSPIQHVKSHIVDVVHGPFSMYKGQEATFETDAENLRKIQEEFNSPPLPTSMIYTPRAEFAAEVKQDDFDENKVDYDTTGLLPGGRLPATVYQPAPQGQIKKELKRVVYSPSVYTPTNGTDIFGVSLWSFFFFFFFLVFAHPFNITLVSQPSFIFVFILRFCHYHDSHQPSSLTSLFTLHPFQPVIPLSSPFITLHSSNTLHPRVPFIFPFP
jgi:hypothetical protein